MTVYDAERLKAQAAQRAQTYYSGLWMTAKRPGTCARCRETIEAGFTIWYTPKTKTALCIFCGKGGKPA